jgi:hypothetical protein
MTSLSNPLILPSLLPISLQHTDPSPSISKPHFPSSAAPQHFTSSLACSPLLPLHTTPISRLPNHLPQPRQVPPLPAAKSRDSHLLRVIPRPPPAKQRHTALDLCGVARRPNSNASLADERTDRRQQGREARGRRPQQNKRNETPVSGTAT